MSIITKMIVNADAEVRYLTPGELDQIGMFVRSSDRRLRLVKTLTESRDFIVKQAADRLFQSCPQIVARGGNAYGKEKTATCLRDMDYYLRLISYSIAAGDGAPIQDIGIVGVCQMYKSLGTPIDSVAESVRAMKTIAISILSGEDASEVGTYFDFLIAALQ